MTGIRVTPEQLQMLAGRVRSSAGRIDGENSALSSTLAPLGTDWAGVAQGRFQQLWADWQRSSKELNQALQGISELMQQAGAHYAEAEQAIASSFGR